MIPYTSLEKKENKDSFNLNNVTEQNYNEVYNLQDLKNFMIILIKL